MKSGFGIYSLPESWVWTNLKDITRTVRDGTHNPPARIEKGYPLLSARNVKEGHIDWTEAHSYISEDDFLELNNANPIDAQDILLTIVGTIGRASVNRESMPFAVQRSVAIIKTYIEYVDPFYLQHLFNGPKFQKLLEQNSKGTAQKGVYLTSLKNLQIPLAPLPEQHHIVARIEELFSRLDAGGASPTEGQGSAPALPPVGAPRGSDGQAHGGVAGGAPGGGGRGGAAKADI